MFKCLRDNEKLTKTKSKEKFENIEKVINRENRHFMYTSRD